MRQLFEVVIRDKKYDVYSIEGKEHQGYNDMPKTWWLYFTDKVPEGTLPPIDSDHFVPYSSSIERSCWDIRFKVVNTHKVKWDEDRFSYHTNCEMWWNGKLIYSFRSGKIEFSMAKAQYLMVALAEHPYNFFEQEKENGRKIWWYNLPAFVKPSDSYPGEIGIIPDYSEIPKEEWWKIYKERSFRPDDDFPSFDREEEGYNSDFINWGDAFSDGHINWFRNERKAPSDGSGGLKASTQ